MSISYSIRPSQIQEWYRPRHGPLLYKTTQRTRNDLIGNAQVIQADQSTFLPSCVQHILEMDPSAIAKLCIDTSHSFADLFVCPSSSRAAWKHLPPLIALDAAFTKVIHHYVLLLAVGQDPKRRRLLLPGELRQSRASSIEGDSSVTSQCP